ncbi:hypothetical protein [Acidocella facilis]|uniref:hypothetical protein n=1 Tax=Acidocella facilis TaxID=525 RepID=UPI001F197D07|nr:hypothetical protein [Acidocella facilis]
MTAVFAAWQSPTIALHSFVMFAGFIAIIIGGLIEVYVFAVSDEKETIGMGDNYTNNGNNFGHMGPINNYGPQPFQLTEDVLRQVLANCPKGKKIFLRGIGHPIKFEPVRSRLMLALQTAGFDVEMGATFDVKVPPPPYPITINTNSQNHTIIDVAPDVYPS